MSDLANGSFYDEAGEDATTARAGLLGDFDD